MTSLSLEPWRLVIDGHAAEIARAVAEDLGPVRARDVTVGHDQAGVVVSLATGERDPMRTVWSVVVQMSRLWPALDAPVGLTVRAGDVVIVTDFEGIEAVNGGCDYGAWVSRATRSTGGPGRTSGLRALPDAP